MIVSLKFESYLSNLCLFDSNVYFFYIKWFVILVYTMHYFIRIEKQEQ